MKQTLVALVTLIGLLTCANANTPANDFMYGCRASIYGVNGEMTTSDPKIAAQIAQCSAAVETIMILGPVLSGNLRFCEPPHASVGQGISIVLKYMHDHPGETDQDFATVAVRALGNTWGHCSP